MVVWLKNVGMCLRCKIFLNIFPVCGIDDCGDCTGDIEACLGCRTGYYLDTVDTTVTCAGESWSMLYTSTVLP